MKKRMSIWDILAWIALISIIIWAILKITGILNSPLFIEYYPLFAASYAFGWQMHKLQIISGEMKDLKKFKNETINQINDFKVNCVRNHK
jgi:hypothetical protein